MEGCRFWVVAVPSGASSKSTLAKLNQATAGKALSANSELKVPPLSVGTLDKLMVLSDSLGKLDEAGEAAVRKIAKQYVETLEDDCRNVGDARKKSAKQKEIPPLMIDNETAASYVRSFVWDKARFPVKTPLDALVQSISTLCDKYVDDLRKHTGRFTEVKTTLLAMQRKETGSLVLRPLHGIVKREHVVAGEYIQTLMVAVPCAKENEWLETYETLEDRIPTSDEPQALAPHAAQCRIVVPNSCLEITRDEECILYRIVVMRKRVQEFKKVARDHRFMCREFVFDASEHAKSVEKKRKLEKERDFLWRNLVKWCSTSYAEVFKAWMHLKVVRTFVESVLRFGLPVSFTAAVLEVKRCNEAKLRKTLADLYSGLSGARMASSGKDDIDYSGVGADFYPYVYLDLNV